MTMSKLSPEARSKIEERLQKLQLINCFDGRKVESKPTPAQQEVLDDVLAHKYRNYWVLGGNQSFPEYCRVLMADGSLKPIGQVTEGDRVVSFNMKTGQPEPSTVVKKWNNGTKLVRRYWYNNNQHLDTTDKHEMVQSLGNGGFCKRYIGEAEHVMKCSYQYEGSEGDESFAWATQKIERMEILGEMEVFDITVDHPSHTFICEGIAVGNSGKSQLLRRVIAWFLAEGQSDIPFKRKPEWQGPLQGLLVSRSHKQLSESLVPGILAFFGLGEIKIVHTSNYIDKIIHIKTGNYIICAVHDQPAQAREKLQSFTVPAVFLDELPSGASAFKLIEELEARCMVMKGFLFAAFTPKSINKLVKDHVESAVPPIARRYTLKFTDNPAVDTETIEARLQQISHMPEHMQKTILEGSWMQSESTVYTLTDYAIQVPVDYSPLWRHVIGVDPGLSSKQGVVVTAEDPTNGRWYVIHSETFSKLSDVDEGVRVVSDYITRTHINVVKIAYDAAGTYWYLHAKKHPILNRYKIEAPWNKNSTARREDMISAVQTAIGNTLFVAPWNDDLIEEFGSYHWSETVPGKIAQSQKYHLLDALRYLVDLLPKFVPQPQASVVSWQQEVQMEIRKYNQESRERAAKRREEESHRSNWRKQPTGNTWRGGKITIK